MNRAQLTAAKHAARHSRIAHLLRTTCPYCHAPAGEPCRSNSGTPIWARCPPHGPAWLPEPDCLSVVPDRQHKSKVLYWR